MKKKILDTHILEIRERDEAEDPTNHRVQGPRPSQGGVYGNAG